MNMVYPCNEIQKVAWNVLRNIDHALALREDDPLLSAIPDVYEKRGIRNGHPQNKMKGGALKNTFRSGKTSGITFFLLYYYTV